MTSDAHGGEAQAVCVLGMHRSGTSLTARMLGALGVHLGPEHTMLEGKPADNPAGFWEQRPIVTLNEEIFALFGAKWWEMPQLPNGWEDSPEVMALEDRARAALEEAFGAARVWGFKDPRTSLTLPFWRRLLGPTRFVVCLRDASEVAASLEHRNREVHRRGESLDVWLAYTAQALAHTDGARRLCLFYQDYFDDPDGQVERLADLVGDVLPVASEDRVRARAVIDAELRHHRSGSTHSPPGMSTEAEELQRACRAMRPGPGEQVSERELASLTHLAGRLWSQRRQAISADTGDDPAGREPPTKGASPADAYLARFDAGPAALEASRAITDRFRANPRTDLTRVAWFVPSFDHVLRGGLRTIFALAEDLSRNHGTVNVFVLCADEPADTELAARLVAEHFPDLHAEYFAHRYGDDPSEIPATGAGICTLWTTAYVLLHYNRCAAKLYLVQDWEPGFYAAGATSGLIEQTYRFGFPILANSPGVAECCRGVEDWVGVFTPGVDQTLFFPEPDHPPGPPYRIVFYGRPRNERNGFALGLAALSRVKAELGEAVDIVSVGGEYDEHSYGASGVVRNLGVLSSLGEVAALYRSCHLGLVFMYTAHPSYQPLEYMASGCVTVSNVNPANGWLLRDRENSLLAPSTVSGVTEAILEGLGDKALRAGLVAGGLATVEELTWEEAYRSARRFLARPGRMAHAPPERVPAQPVNGGSARSRQSGEYEPESLALSLERFAADHRDEVGVLADRVDLLSGAIARLEGQVAAQATAGVGKGGTRVGEPRRGRSPRARLPGRGAITGRLRMLRTYLTLRTSGQFDREHYLSAYPEVAERGVDPIMHYLEEGWREGRDPSPTFSTNDYLAARRDVARAGINPLLHHVRYGPTPDTSGRSRRTVRRLRSMAGRARALTPLPEDTLERGPLRKERDLTEAFVRRYAKATGGPLSDGAPELPSEAVPVDRRGVLVQPGDQPDGAPSVDVVVCVHDALADLRRCVLSLLAKTRRPFHLILVNDGSGPETSEFLRRFAEQNPAVEVVAREPPHGYTLAANAGVRAATGDYVVLLNSDTIVTFGWLARIIECGESDPAIGIVGPLSNAASYQSVPKLKEAGAWAVNELPDFLTPDGLASLLSGISTRSYPRFPFLNGFCYAVKREVIDSIGLFDEEHFASGYCEENDFSLRASQEGFELAVTDDAYVFHAKSRSYGQAGRREIAKRNYQIFLRKHGEDVINPRVQQLDRDTSLDPLRERVAGALGDGTSFARAFRVACPNPLSVGFVLHGMGRGAAGGVHSIYQETRGMRALGIDARVLVPSAGLDNARRLYPDADEVFTGFADEGDLARRSADRDVLVATHFRSVAFVRALREQRDDFVAAYYVQDYEPFFFDERSSEGKEALASYTAIPGQLLFAKTQWLCDLVSRVHERHVAKVEPSIDHEVYRVGERRRRSRGPVRVVAMVRPRTWRRQPLGTLRVLDRLQTELEGEVEVMCFGCEPNEIRDLSPRRAGRVNNLGLLTREQVAETLARSDVFLDFSSYQAFGRTALEAMACGCASVVPKLGGPDEYAIHGENAFVIDTSSEDAAVEAVAELVADRERLRRMQSAAVTTARSFSTLRAALSEYTLFAEQRPSRHAVLVASGGERA